MLKIIEHTKVWFGISLTIILIGIGFMCTKHLQFGIDFKGGTVVDINMGKEFNTSDIDTIVKKYTKEYQLQTINKTTLEIKSASISSEKVPSIFNDIKTKYKLDDKALTSTQHVSASIGSETTWNAIKALVIANLIILAYIAFRFEWRFGVAAILALIHDVLITLSIYAIFQITVDPAFIAAMLTIIGYSMSDTIVVFDRIRENQKYMRGKDIVELADASITQTLVRSINTVLTVLITLTCVHIFVPSVRNFTSPLLVGVVSGCYSSIFIASPFWVIFKKKAKKNNVKTTKATV